MVLELKEVTKRFGNFTAVDHLSLKIPEKEMFGFLGANGAGKTTTFRMILGLLNPSDGSDYMGWKARLIIRLVRSLAIFLKKEAYIQN